MPAPGKRWYHLVLHTHGSWLHGDPRGFRSRKHRLHSSGDYKNPPPQGEHAKLHAYQQAQSTPAVCIPDAIYPAIGEAILNKARKLHHQVLAISVGATHAHLLIEIPNDYDAAKRIAGQLKQAASHQVGHALPGKIWASGGKPIEVDTPDHHRRVYAYILRHRTEGDWTWSVKSHPQAVVWGEHWRA
ncbi:MAG: hypothetical protein ACIAXF_03960 [Phycisphaerales bacterium JB063]